MSEQSRRRNMSCRPSALVMPGNEDKADRYRRLLLFLVVAMMTHLTALQQRLTDTLISLVSSVDRSARPIMLMTFPS
ncbi:MULTISPECIES: hypothetical protein [Brevibacterium]|uniref:Uncharacterized protein n=2 Tax=Micrococcales TaxID=85006 RepID=A0A7T4A2P4_9MICO|nr:hypothetical protein [Brevibacterium casei]MDO4255105.1 hypothetical protein [Kocuria sp.]QQB16226.1 hypothetical protein I6H47_16150 [Brevibacterium casei]